MLPDRVDRGWKAAPTTKNRLRSHIFILFLSSKEVSFSIKLAASGGRRRGKTLNPEPLNL
jgi:hypothetical protein